MQVTAIRKCRGKPTRILMCDVENINGRKKFDLKKKEMFRHNMYSFA